MAENKPEVEVQHKKESQYRWIIMGLALLLLALLISRERPLIKPWVFASGIGVIALWITLEFVKEKREPDFESLHKKARIYLLGKGFKVPSMAVYNQNGRTHYAALGDFLDPARELYGIFFPRPYLTVIFRYEHAKIVGLVAEGLGSIRTNLSQEWHLAQSIHAAKAREEALKEKMEQMGVRVEAAAA